MRHYSLLLFFLCSLTLSCKKKGCIDQNAHNYDQNASKDDGSCETCDDGIQNGDEGNIDCGDFCGVPCVSHVYYTTSNSDIPDNTINDITEDAAGNLWLATMEGISKFDGTNFTTYNSSNSELQHNTVMSIFAENGNIWVGTINHGIALFDGTNWTQYDNDINIAYAINDIKEFNNKLYVATTFRGLSILENGTRDTTYNIENSDLESDRVNAIDFDTDGDLWLATGAGLANKNATGWTTWNTSNSDLLDNYIRKVIVDQNDEIWVIHSAGIQKFDGQAWTTITEETTNATSIGEHSDGSIWWSNGLVYRYAEETDVFHYQELDIGGLSIHMNDDIWIGGNGDGLLKLIYL